MLAASAWGWPRTIPADDRPAAAERAVSLQSNCVKLNECLVKAVKTARLATDRPGVLASVQPKEGDTVREGQIVARLMDEVPQANLDVANLVADDQVEIQYATKLNAVDAIEYAKNIEANRKHENTVPDIEVLRSKLAMERSKLQIDKAEHEIAVNKLKAKQAEAELNTYRILAPFDGVVTRIQKYRGEAVRQGDPILEVVNTDVVQVEGFVNEKEIWNVKVGSPVTVRLSVRDADLEIEKQEFQGRIGFVDVVANSASRETRVWAEVPNPNNVLRPGLRATMTILPGPSAGAAGVKTSAISAPGKRMPNGFTEVFNRPAFQILARQESGRGEAVAPLRLETTRIGRPASPVPHSP
jgi:RND family efflux transporter MFP subunit